MQITGKTRVFCIIGYPIEHSLSPLMFNVAFRELNLDYTYVPFEVRPPDLADAIKAIRALNIMGMNITIPYKESIIKFLDTTSGFSKMVGAVNTVSFEDGRLVGHNTDGQGLIRGLEVECNLDPSGMVVMIMGAGGAAKGISFALAEFGTREIFIVNRTFSRARHLTDNLKENFSPGKFIPIELYSSTMNEYLKRADILINATSVGMDGSRFDGLSMDKVKDTMVVVDIVYSPLNTPLIEEAGLRGLKTHNGLIMLIYQGAENLRIWTGLSAPVDKIKEALLEYINRRLGISTTH